MMAKRGCSGVFGRPGGRARRTTKLRWHSRRYELRQRYTVVPSQVAFEGVSYTVVKLSFARRMELMRRVRDLARRLEFLQAVEEPASTMESGLLRAEVDRIFLTWGLRAVSGLAIDGAAATPELLAEAGPENLLREALAAVRAETGLNAAERKN